MKNVAEQLFIRIIKPYCSFCNKRFSSSNLPRMMCPDQHLCCALCYNSQVIVHKGKKCPTKECQKRTTIHYKDQSVQLFSQILEFYNQIINLAQIEECHSIKYFNDQINQSIQSSAQNLFYKAEDLLLMGNIQQSINTCKEVIKLKPIRWMNFKGLGHPISQLFCNDQAHIQSYRRHKQTQKERSVYDLLNVCVSLKNDYIRQEKWYFNELQKRLISIELYMGLGILYFKNQNIQKSKLFLKLAFQINQNPYIRYYHLKAFELIFNENFPFYREFSNPRYFFESYQKIDERFNKNDEKLPPYLATLKIFTQQYSYVERNLEQSWIRDQREEQRYYYYSQLKSKLQNCLNLLRDIGCYFPLHYIIGRYYIFLEQYEKSIEHFEIYQKYVKDSNLNSIKIKFYLAYAYSMLPIFPQKKIELINNYINEYITSTNQRSQKINIESNWILAKIYKQQRLISKAIKKIQLYQSQHPPFDLQKYNQQSFSYRYRNKQNQQKRITFYHRILLQKAELYQLDNNLMLQAQNYEIYLSVFKNDYNIEEKIQFL